jgi:sugar phosphate isomerase/epimerase
VLVGSMNDPRVPLERELRRIADAGFDFVDLTLEPPGAWPADGAAVGRLLAELELGAVGHTAFYLPIASPLPELRETAHRLFVQALDVFAAAGIGLANVHPDPAPTVLAADAPSRNADSVARLAEAAEERGLRLMVENLGRLGTVDELRPLLEAAPDAGFHLDVGHANLGLGAGEPNRTAALLEAFGDRLAHVHVSDNRGVDDLHLPLGAGTIDWPAAVAALKAAGWDGTVTLEIHAQERAHLETSRRLWLDWWNA